MSQIKSPDRYNSADGRARTGPDSKETGASLVAKVMGRAEKGQPRGDQQNRDRMGVKFEIEDGNRAKRIDHDAAPR